MNREQRRREVVRTRSRRSRRYRTRALPRRRRSRARAAALRQRPPRRRRARPRARPCRAGTRRHGIDRVTATSADDDRPSPRPRPEHRSAHHRRAGRGTPTIAAPADRERAPIDRQPRAITRSDGRGRPRGTRTNRRSRRRPTATAGARGTRELVSEKCDATMRFVRFEIGSTLLASIASSTGWNASITGSSPTLRAVRT